eukprot:6983553-Pyramimonas_sp.AAC.1
MAAATSALLNGPSSGGGWGEGLPALSKHHGPAPHARITDNCLAKCAAKAGSWGKSLLARAKRSFTSSSTMRPLGRRAPVCLSSKATQNSLP